VRRGENFVVESGIFEIADSHFSAAMKINLQV